VCKIKLNLGIRSLPTLFYLGSTKVHICLKLELSSKIRHVGTFPPEAIARDPTGQEASISGLACTGLGIREDESAKFSEIRKCLN